MTTWEKVVALVSRQESGAGDVLGRYVARNKHGGLMLEREGDSLTIVLESEFDRMALEPYTALVQTCVQQLRPDITTVTLGWRDAL
jgi:hypothetical protein|tara:strand:- start:57 stop:314 length:258 start_codon:yes stop_codon:yes gene_type:complete